MEKAVKQRIRSLLAEFGSNPTVLAKEYSVNQKTLNNQINSDTQLSASTILLVLNAFSDISAEWLLRGKGEMLLNNSSQIAPVESSNELISLRAENAVLREMVGLKKKDDRSLDTKSA